jgi:uncharacterized protein
MEQPTKRTAFTLRDTGAPLKWTILFLLSLGFIVPLELMQLPAALLLGAMAAAIVVAVFDGKLTAPHWPYVLAQGLIGCLVARSIGPAILVTMAQQWPPFLGGVCSVLLISTSLGALRLGHWPAILARHGDLRRARLSDDRRLDLDADPLTAYLATSPGGADSVAIIAASSSHVDVPFVMAMQMARFILVLLVGPALARAVARWTKN